MRATLRSILQTLRRLLLPKRSDIETESGTPEPKPEEEQKSPEALPDSVTIVNDILRQIETAEKDDDKKTRRNPGKEEWRIFQTDFIYAYHFLLSLPHVSHERMQNRVRAGIITFTLPLADGCIAELTDNSRHIKADGVLRVTDGKRELIKVLFIDNSQNNDNHQQRKE